MYEPKKNSLELTIKCQEFFFMILSFVCSFCENASGEKEGMQF